MTTKYDTKEQALEMGAFYAGYSDAKERKKVLAEADISSIVLGFPHSRPATDDDPGVEKKLETYEFPNSDGVKVCLGVSEFRDRYDLWLIFPNGMVRRT